MTHQVTLRYDEQLLRRVVLCFWWRVVGLPFVVALVVAAASLVVLILGGDRSWIVGFLATVLGMGIAVIVAVYVVHYRNVMQKFKATGRPRSNIHRVGVIVFGLLWLGF